MRGQRGILDEVYAATLAVGTPKIETDLATAQLVKVAANSFLATKISFINAMAELCEATGADVTMLADAIGHDSRIGRRFLNAGVGFGGGCLPKDIRAFMARAGELGVDQALSFLREVDSINMRRRVRMVDLAREVCGGSIVGRRIAVLGAAFKPHSDDIRDSPALNVAAQMQLQGARVTVADPAAVDNARKKWPELSLCRPRRGRSPRRGGRAAAHRVARVRRARPGLAQGTGRRAAHHRRSQLPRPGHLAGRGLDLPGAGSPLRAPPRSATGVVPRRPRTRPLECTTSPSPPGQAERGSSGVERICPQITATGRTRRVPLRGPRGPAQWRRRRRRGRCRWRWWP